MKHIHSIITFALGLAFASASAVAAGSHAGGHDAKHESGEGAIGQPSKAAQATRTVTIEMTDDMRFTPAQVAVKQGETVRFIVRNAGRVKHEMVLGTPEELREHYAMMMKMPEMEHADENQVTVAPGGTGEVIWQFTKAGNVDFACLQPGHYDAGMKGLVKVARGQGIMSHGNMGGMNMPGMKMESSAAAGMTEGEVRKIDRDNQKITLRHGALKNLDMPGMTMVFGVRDAAMLSRVQVGSKVHFMAEKVEGSLVVTAIEVTQ